MKVLRRLSVTFLRRSSAVPGVPHRSLARSVAERNFKNCAKWKTVDDVPAGAIDDFVDETDPNTSLWDDGVTEEHRLDVLVSLLLNRPSVGPMTLVLLWQDCLAEDLGRRIIATPGDTSYAPGVSLHYEVHDAAPEDYPRLALGAGQRNQPISLKRAAVRDILEDVYAAGAMPATGIHPQLRLELDGLINSRFMAPTALRDTENLPVFDIRGKDCLLWIPGAVQSSQTNILSDLARRRIGMNDTFVLYCQDGSASRQLAKILRDKGYKPKTLEGGFALWHGQGLPTDARA